MKKQKKKSEESSKYIEEKIRKEKGYCSNQKKENVTIGKRKLIQLKEGKCFIKKNKNILKGNRKIFSIQ